MQNHHSLIYREEEREMFPTLNVSTTLILHQGETPEVWWYAALRRCSDPVVVARPGPPLSAVAELQG